MAAKQKLIQELCDAHGANLHPDFNRAVELLPEEPGTWMIATDRPAVYLLDGETLTVLETETSEKASVALTARRLDPLKLTATLKLGASKQINGMTARVNYWSFCMDGEPLLPEFPGTAGDQAERFARALAKLAGLDLPDQPAR